MDTPQLSRTEDWHEQSANLRELVRPLGVILGLYFLAAALYIAASPVFEKPDEPWHFAFATYLAKHQYRLPDLNTIPPDYFADQEGTQPPLYYLLYAAILDVFNFKLDDADYAHLFQLNPQFAGHSIIWPDNINKFVGGNCQTDSCQSMILGLYTGRILNVVFGAFSVVSAAIAVKIVFPRRLSLTLMTAALIAFLPQFLYIATSVNNDLLTVFGVNTAFALGMWWLKYPKNTRTLIALGIVVGFTALSKTSGLSIGFSIGLLLLFAHPFPWRTRLRTIAIFGVSVFIIAGWWYLRNWIRYGDPTAINTHLSIFQKTDNALTLDRFLLEWGGVINSFYGEFGWGTVQLSPRIYLLIRIGAFVLAALFTVASIRTAPQWTRQQRTLMLLSGLQIVVIVGLLFRWMRLTEAAIGRLLFPAILPIMLFMAIGLVAIFPQTYRQRFTRLWISGSIAVAFSIPVIVIYPAYRPAAPLVEIQANGAPWVQFLEEGSTVNAAIIGMAKDVEEDWLLLQFTWSVQSPFQDDYQLFIHVRDINGAVIAQRDSHPGLGNRPTTIWKGGEIFGDVYPIPFSGRGEDIASIAIGLYTYQNGLWQRVPVESTLVDVVDNAVVIPYSHFEPIVE